MIYELRTYTLKPGAQAGYLQIARDVGRPIRGDDYGAMVGAWTTEFGTLNRYLHLWSYPNLGERERLRQALAKNERWTREYVPQIRPLMVAQENTLLTAADVFPFTPPAPGRHVYELRTYPAQPGKLAEWARLAPAGLEARAKYSRPVGFWTTEVGALNQLVHLWVYDDLNQRAEVRARANQDPDWADYVAKTTSFWTGQHSVILNPTEFSPLQ